MTPHVYRRAVLFTLAFACATGQKKSETAMTPSTPRAANDTEVPLIAAWQGPWGGAPPFGKFKVEEIKTAMEGGMARTLAEIE
jgi:peptidyl-dipeptidase Dcp